MKRFSILLLALYTCALLGAWQQAQAKSNPTIIVIDPVGAGIGPFQGTQAPGINTAGAVTGFFSDSNNVMHGFVRSPAGDIKTFDAPGAGSKSVPGFLATPVGVLGGQGTYCWSINPGGAITGFYADSDNVVHGFVRSTNGAFTTFDITGAGTGAGQGTEPTSIGPSGEIVGDVVDSSNVTHGFVGDLKNGFVVFDATGAGTNSGQGTFAGVASGITPGGVVTGWLLDTNYIFHGWIREADGAISTFEAPGAGTAPGQGTFSWSISQDGSVTAEVVDGGGVAHTFVRDKQGNLTVFDVPGAGTGPGQGTVGEGINAAGAVAGQYVDSGGVNHGFVHDRNGNVVKFDAPGAGVSTGQGTIPLTPNPAGAIAGAYLDSSNVLHGFLLIP